MARFKTVQVPVAPPQEQHRIVEVIERELSKLDDAIANLNRVRANLKRYRASVLKAAVEGRLVPTEAELARREGRSYEPASVLLQRILKERRRRWEESGRKGKYVEPVEPDTSGLPELPEGWVWASLDALADLKGGITKNQARRSSEPLRDVPYLRVANVQRGFLDLSEVTTIPATKAEIAELQLQPGDVLFNEGGDRDKLGRGWIWEGQIRECIHQNHVFRARLYSGDISPKLLSWYGNTDGQKYFFDEGKQTTNLASLNMTKLRNLPVPVSPAREQVRMVSEIERLLSLADEAKQFVEANLRRCLRLRQSILKAAFEGKLVPQDPNDEPASVLLERIRAEREKAGGEKKARRSRAAPTRSAVRMSPGATSPEGLDDEQEQARTPARRASSAAASGEGGHPDRGIHPADERPARQFLDLDPDERAEEVFLALWPRGPFMWPVAVKMVAEDLRERGLADFQRFRRDGPLGQAIHDAMNLAARYGYLSRPRRGWIGAVCADARRYSAEHWRAIVEASGAAEIDDLDDAIRTAAEWAQENLGLEFERLRRGGVIWKGIEEARKSHA